jgi:cyclophilin family peptidyl-prolyl cis-trans isomerase
VKNLTVAIFAALLALACPGALAQESTNPANTIVRFDIRTAGTNFGSLDIELFDQDKPESVRNFLLYVGSGVYSNLILHRLERQFVMQAGHALLDTNATSLTNEFKSYKIGRNYGPVTNEFSVGPTYSNVFGTIAMARVPGATNSGSVDWYINLENNFFLDDVDGGFTVFGRVIHSTASNNGTNLLNYFAHYTNIIARAIATPPDSLTQLPVSANHAPPQIGDLFTITTTVLRGVQETNPPAFAVTTPDAGMTNSAASPVRFTGTASDDSGIARIAVDAGYGPSFMPGTTNWFTYGQLEETTNTTIRLWAIDWKGNESTPVERTILFTPPPHTNTVVRFTVRTAGTNYGSLDIELLDAYKPATVENFLLYVYAGSYSNIAIHRLEPGSKLRSGHAIIEKPGITNIFNSYKLGPNYGSITNEFGVGPRIGNQFGTISLARFSGAPDSGSQDWFINLKNDPDRDFVDGGDTVFGRIINTTNLSTGTNLLSLFRDHTNYVAKLIFDPIFESLGELPVSTVRYSYRTNFTTNVVSVTNGTDVVLTTNVTSRILTNKLEAQIRDLFTLSASIPGAARFDTRKPRLTYTAPTARTRVVTTNTLRVTGTAADNLEVLRVLYNTGSGIKPATGKTNWTTDLSLKPGTNDFVFWSVDRFGNNSTLMYRKIFYSLPKPISLAVSGSGKITGATNGQLLEVGRNYLLNAVAGPRSYFSRWDFTNLDTNNPGHGFTNAVPWQSVSVPMEEGQHCTAVFATNPYPRLAGVYHGLLVPRHNATNFPTRVTGGITLTLGASGLYAGRLQPLAATYPMRGMFNGSLRSSISGTRNGVVLALGLTIFTNGTERILGTYQDGPDVADVVLYRTTSALDTNPPPSGSYNFAITPQTNSAAGEGLGNGTVVFGTNRSLTMSGVLSDGTPVSQNTSLLAGDHWAFLAKPYGKQGAVLGMMAFGTNNTVTGDMRWLKSGGATDMLDAATLYGSQYSAPAADQTLLGWTNGTVTLSGDALGTNFEATVTLEPGGGITVLSNTVNLALSVSAEGGTITGSFVHPVTHLATPLQAVALQSASNAAGFFLSTNRSGAFRLRPAP